MSLDADLTFTLLRGDFRHYSHWEKVDIIQWVSGRCGLWIDSKFGVDWCAENIGTKGYNWTWKPVNGIITFYFRYDRDATAFREALL